jgi:hypothetical protein
MRRDDAGNDDATFSELEKRSSRKLLFCIGDKQMSLVSPQYDESGPFMRDNTNYLSYGRTNAADCNDYGFGQVSTPPRANSAVWNTEHILELQTVQIFMNSMQIVALYPDVNSLTSPVAPEQSGKFP